MQPTEYLHETVTVDFGGRDVSGRVTDIDYGLSALRSSTMITITRDNGATISVSPDDICKR